MKPTFSLLLLLLSALNVSHAQSRNSYEQRHYQGKMIDLTQHSLSELTLSFYSPKRPRTLFRPRLFQKSLGLSTPKAIFSENFKQTLSNSPSKEPHSASKEILLTGHKEKIQTLCFHPSQALLASAGHDQFIHLWSLLFRSSP
jgi:WD40 repeat protein